MSLSVSGLQRFCEYRLILVFDFFFSKKIPGVNCLIVVFLFESSLIVFTSLPKFCVNLILYFIGFYCFSDYNFGSFFLKKIDVIVCKKTPIYPSRCVLWDLIVFFKIEGDIQFSLEIEDVIIPCRAISPCIVNIPVT